MYMDNTSLTELNLTSPFNLLEQTWSGKVIIYGYLSPLIVVFTIITNTLISVVLLRKNMRTATNSFLVAMALSDMMTGVFPIPCFLYFYTLENYREWVPFEWCGVFNLLSDVIPTIFHTASIWLTMALATQRYICICHSVKAKTWCTIPNVIKGTVVIYIVAIFSQLCRFFDQEYHFVTLPSLVKPNTTVSGCDNHESNWAQQNLVLYWNLYWWFRVIFIHLVPCTALVVLNALLVHAMRDAQRKREQLLRQNRRSESKKLKDINGTTMMLVLVVGVFLLVEVPLGIELVIMIIQNTFNFDLIDARTLDSAALFTNFLILLSYPINFFIYCGMSHQFRETFKGMFSRSPMPIDREHSRYISLASHNGRSHCAKTEVTAI